MLFPKAYTPESIESFVLFFRVCQHFGKAKLCPNRSLVKDGGWIVFSISHVTLCVINNLITEGSVALHCHTFVIYFILVFYILFNLCFIYELNYFVCSVIQINIVNFFILFIYVFFLIISYFIVLNAVSSSELYWENFYAGTK